MALTPAEHAELDGLLASRAKISAGGAIEEVQGANRRVKYAKPDGAALDRRIAELQGAATGCRRRGAIGFRV